MNNKKLKHISEIELPRELFVKDGVVKLNNSQLKVELRCSIRRGDEITPKVIIDAVTKCSYPIRGGKKVKTCQRCKGNVFERIKEGRSGGLIFTKWQCLNCGSKSDSTRLDRTEVEKE